jgi:pyruvate formate lyase activating enzyme
MKGIIFRIERFAIHDGPGIRTTVFLKGCPLRCAWCHSPESQSPTPEFMPLADRCIACGRCVAACPEHALAPVAATAGARPAVPLPGKGARPLDSGRLNPPGVRREKTDGFRPDPGGVKKAAVSDLTPEVTPEGCRLCGACVEACPTGARVLAGQEMSVAAVVGAIERDRIFYDESGGGVTFSGGEPLMQAPFLAALVEECRTRRIHVAVDTSGFGAPAALDKIRPDVFLFDLKVVDEAWHREITGVSNRVILENLARLAARVSESAPELQFCKLDQVQLRTSLIVRFPLVPGLTDGDDNVRGIGRLVASLGITRVDVLPYHRAGLAKYDRLGKRYALAQTEPPTPGQVQRVVELLSEHRLTVRVGGA